MSKLNAGNIPIMVADKEYLLRPTLDAIVKINTQFGGLRKARDAVVNEDIAAVVFIIQAGANLPPNSIKALTEAVFDAGINDLLLPLMQFVMILGNGGRPLSDEPDDAATEGNVAA